MPMPFAVVIAFGPSRTATFIDSLIEDMNKRAGHKPPAGKVVFLFDVDNTLLDNDRVVADLKKHLQGEIGQERAKRYWGIFERSRNELGYADYLGSLQRYRSEYPRDARVLT